MEMVLLYSGSSPDKVSQCSMAEKAFGLFDCCLEGSQPKCNSPVHRDDIALEWHRWGVQVSRLDKSLSAEEALAHLDSLNRPIEVGLRFTGPLGGAHALLLIGVVLVETEHWALVLDPREGRKFLKYSELLTAYSRGTWLWTWKIV